MYIVQPVFGNFRNLNYCYFSDNYYVLVSVSNKVTRCYYSLTTHVQVFDEAADGYVRAETAAAVVISKTCLARRAYATVLGTRTNTDGYDISLYSVILTSMSSILTNMCIAHYTKLSPSNVTQIALSNLIPKILHNFYRPYQAIKKLLSYITTN